MLCENCGFTINAIAVFCEICVFRPRWVVGGMGVRVW